ncbi:MAG TPA: hypothetical protein VMI72_13810, partial [Roseiarcus sp.]|nr:hypothetical protein [Roseiarcus sp.]
RGFGTEMWRAMRQIDAALWPSNVLGAAENADDDQLLAVTINFADDDVRRFPDAPFKSIRRSALMTEKGKPSQALNIVVDAIVYCVC